MKKEEYDSCIKKEEESWVGVTIYCDKSSDDKYARFIGWYGFSTAPKKHRIYTSLYDALRAYDKSIIEARGRDNVDDSKLNFP